MREFNHNSTWDSVADMTINEAISILSRDANSNGEDWSARPHKAKAAQMAIKALQFYKDFLAGIEDGYVFIPPKANPSYTLELTDSETGMLLGIKRYNHIPHTWEHLMFRANNKEYTLRISKIVDINTTEEVRTASSLGLIKLNVVIDEVNEVNTNE